MAKFLTLWETDMSRVPENPEEARSLYTKLINMIKEDMESGRTKDFGYFFSGNEGYSIDEGTEEEIALAVMKCSPYIKCKVYPILSVSQVDSIMKTLSY
jgi:hypothetical protein